MRLAMTLLLALVMTAHAALGCCWHHDHGGEALPHPVCCEHDHEHESHSAPLDHETPINCDEAVCVYMVHDGSVPPLDFLTTLSGVIDGDVRGMTCSLLRSHYLTTLDEISHPSGPRLHLLQCVLVI